MNVFRNTVSVSASSAVPPNSRRIPPSSAAVSAVATACGLHRPVLAYMVANFTANKYFQQLANEVIRKDLNAVYFFGEHGLPTYRNMPSYMSSMRR